MWCLARCLPLMIGDLVPEGNERWQLFLLLLDIVDYVFAPKTTRDIIAYVRLLINDHHREFRRLYPDCSIIPKHHYMIHIPEWMERYVLQIKYSYTYVHIHYIYIIFDHISRHTWELLLCKKYHNHQQINIVTHP